MRLGGDLLGADLIALASLRDHYHAATPGSPLPRILGLTASPIFNPKNPGKSIA